MSKSNPCCPPRSRGGFTLIELLVVITIIAILAALITPAYFSVRRTTFEMTIAHELAQLEGSLEKFKDEFGFYPPDFSEFVAADGTPLDFTDVIANSGGVTVEQRLLQFLAKISPTHNENSADPVDVMESRLGHWWHTVGQIMITDLAASGAATKENRLRGPQHAAWFWLSQLYNDAQYPITGQRLNNVFGSDVNTNGIDDSLEIVSEREVLHDFQGAGLEERVLAAPIFFPGGTIEYKLYRPIQQGGDGPLVYFHHETYVETVANLLSVSTSINFFPGSAIPNIVKPIRVPGSTLPQGQFLNPTSFQIVAPGWDESFGNIDSLVQNELYPTFDNLANFTEGRLDAFVENYQNP